MFSTVNLGVWYTAYWIVVRVCYNYLRSCSEAVHPLQNIGDLRFWYSYCSWISCCSFSGGTVVGDLAPHEAFPIGGTNSVRGYDEGAVGSGRSCIVASGEISIPLVCPWNFISSSLAHNAPFFNHSCISSPLFLHSFKCMNLWFLIFLEYQYSWLHRFLSAVSGEICGHSWSKS